MPEDFNDYIRLRISRFIILFPKAKTNKNVRIRIALISTAKFVISLFPFLSILKVKYLFLAIPKPFLKGSAS